MDILGTVAGQARDFEGRSVDALEAGDELFGEGFTGLSPEEAAADAAVLFDEEGEGEELFDVLLDVDLSGLVEGSVVGREGQRDRELRIGDPGGVDAEVDEDLAVLLEAGAVEFGAEAEDSDSVRAHVPGVLRLDEGWQVCVWVVPVGVSGGGDAEAVVGVLAVLGNPELPTHLELVCHVVVELLGGLGDGGVDECVGGVVREVDWGEGIEVRGVFDGAVDALVCWGLGEVDGIYGGSGDALFADQGELAEDTCEGGGKGLQPEVGVPEAEIEAVCHGGSF